jgi:hypothetical protein
MKIIEVNRVEDLAAYASRWEALLNVCAHPAPSQTPVWVQAFLRHALRPDRTWVCLLAFEAEELVAVLFLLEGFHAGRPGCGVRLFRTADDPFHTVRAEALIRPGSDQALERFVQHLTTSHRILPVLLMKGVPESGSVRTALALNRVRPGRTEQPAGQEDVLTCCGDFGAWRAKLNGKFRRELERQQRRLEEQGPVHFRLFDRNRSCQANMELFAQIEDSGWKGSNGTSLCKHQHDFKLFMEAVEKFEAHHEVVWSFLETGSEYIAGQLGVRIGDTLYLWKIGYCEAWSRYAPGHLLLYRLIEALHARPDIKTLNFMNERSWLQAFQTGKRRLYDVLVFPRIPGLTLLLRTGWRLHHFFYRLQDR